MTVRFNRDERFEMRLSVKEKDLLEKAALQEGMSLADWVRSRTLKAARQELEACR